MKKKYKFSFLMFLYFNILIVVSFIIVGYVRNLLLEFDDSNEVNYIKKQIANIPKDSLETFAKNNNLKKSIYETNRVSIIDSYKEILNNEKIIIDKYSTNTFDVKLNERKLFTVSLNEKDHVNKLLVLSYPVWEIESITPTLYRGLIYYDVTLPSNYKIYINDQIVYNALMVEKKDISTLDDVNNSSLMPKMIKYEINYLTSIPKIEIKDSFNNLVDYEIEGYNIIINDYFLKSDDYDAIKDSLSGEIDVKNIAEKWSLFLSKHLNGVNYGYDIMKNYLLDDTYVNKMAYKWAFDIDITQMITRSLSSTPFSNEVINNYVVYNKDIFSCDVYLEKNLIINGNVKPDILNNKIYFIYNNNTWKILGMENIRQ